MSLQPRVVQIHRQTEYEQLLASHGTRQQAAFFLDRRQQSIDELVERHDLVHRARQAVASAIPSDWRRTDVGRRDLAHFQFAEEDIVVIVGQDGLVANVAKYLSGQPVVGVNPDRRRNGGVLAPHGPESVPGLLAALVKGQCPLQRRTMVAATTDDGQQIQAVNEVYYGHRSHQSALYRIELADGSSEHHSSSGVLIGTGTGSTGWLRSAWQERRSTLDLPGPEADELCWFVREAWPGVASGTDLTEGLIAGGTALKLRAERDELVCFGDGIEGDALQVGWGQSLTVSIAPRTLNLVMDGCQSRVASRSSMV